MKDRVPGSPGRVLITPEGGGAAFYATMARADNPIQEGDPLNKATLLTDETAALLGLGASAVPDDAFRALNPKIGDVINTVRTDLGDKWMLCNGDTFLPKTYPAFAELMKNITWTGNTDFLTRKDILTLSATFDVSEVFCENGKYFFFYESGNSPGIVVLEADGV